MKIQDIDKNFKLNSEIKEENIIFRDVKSGEFEINGLICGDEYRRMSEKDANAVSENVKNLSLHTSGGRIRFKTNSKYVALRAIVNEYSEMMHMTRLGQTGFDIYDRNVFKTSFAPSPSGETECENIYYFRDDNEHDVTINLPLYNGIKKMYIGLEENAYIKKSERYDKKIVFYGSSITQGGCASRPGNSYASILSRRFNCDYTNLGFSGNAKGEKEMAHYIANLEMDIFVYDYDHNAPDVSDLLATHKPFFDIIRLKNKDLPVIFVSRPDVRKNLVCAENNKNAILNTYNKALESGDKNVYFVDGFTLWGDEGYDECSVDGTHPNDLGMYRMANAIGKPIEEILKKQR